MADKDPWLGVAWKVYASQGQGGSRLKPSAKEGAFTLDAVTDPVSGKTVYYTVDFKDGNMPSCWQAILLYPLGTVTLPPPVPLLQPWKPNGDGPWLAAADAVRRGLNDSVARLEAVLDPYTNPGFLTLVCVPHATTTGTPLLVMQLRGSGSSGSTGAVQPLDTAGGHGDN